MARASGNIAPGPIKGNGDFRLLMLGNAVSEFGTAMGAITVILIAFKYSTSAIITGLIDAVEMLALFLIGVPAGWVADHYSKRIIMKISACGGLISYGLLAWLVFAGRFNFVLLFVFILCVSTASCLYRACGRAALRSIVQSEDIGVATSIVQARAAICSVLGPPIGGLLFATFDWLPLAINSITFLAPILAILLIRRSLADNTCKRTDATFKSSMLIGMAFIAHHRVLRSLTAIGAIASFASAGYVITLVISMQQRHFSATLTGAVQSACAIGLILGALFSQAVAARISLRKTAVLALSLAAFGFATAALAETALIILPALAAGCILVVPLLSAIATYETMTVPITIQGRVTTADEVLTDGLNPLAPLIGTILLTTAGHILALLVFAGLLAAAAVFSYLARGLRILEAQSEFTVHANIGNNEIEARPNA
ncbi:MFS transporter [Nakamurella antarctica]|uniref:MFS transporter n=1 Tax=Nakamurella antarctica TaxID=1902245 RepID=A0A3G8ZJY1_9ACTN|nr:MFS transporter [Nakamurella antarctica]AZI57087.1 MFS transporter [Nakamurella antarctica]